MPSGLVALTSTESDGILIIEGVSSVAFASLVVVV